MKKINPEKNLALYRQLALELMQQIQSGKIQENEKLPDIRTMGQLKNMHYHTVRLAYLELREAGYATSTRRGGTVACLPKRQRPVHVVIPKQKVSSYADDICRGIHEHLRSMKIPVQFHDYREQPDLELQILRGINLENAGGVLLLSQMTAETGFEAMRLLTSGIPLVLADRDYPLLPCWSVASDNYQGGRLAAECLLRRGCQNPIMVVDDRYSSTLAREQGFRDLLAERGVSNPPARIVRMAPDEIDTAIPVERFLALDPRPDGVFFYNDYQALKGIQALHERGIRIPAEIAVVGFDDMDVATLCFPALTTIRQDGYAIGRQAVELWREQLAIPAEERKCGRRVLLPVTLVERASA